MTHNTNTATVETLTAEVRVVAVGIDQLTVVMVRQLDYVELSDLNMFGRVKLDDQELVIGSDTDGRLALARYHTHRKPYQWISTPLVPMSWTADELPVIPHAMFTYSREIGVTAVVSLDGMRCRFYRDEVRVSGDGSKKSELTDWEPGPHVDILREQVHAELAEINESHELYLKAGAAPLIVLK
jgi:hypothetical protein